jgi:Kunitz/Bovine pancreatic trypsin inhibitor domain
MYRYDAASKQCVMFVYGGCGGNENQLRTINECIEICGAKNLLKPPSIFQNID